MNHSLDATDYRLIELLQKDGLQSMAELSKAIGVAPSTLNDRVKRLGRLGVIKGTHARIEPTALGLNLLAYVMVAISEKATEAEFLDRIRSSPEVLECHHIAGALNYILKVRVKTMQDLEEFLGTVVKQAPVQRAETMIALSSVKDGNFLVAP